MTGNRVITESILGFPIAALNKQACIKIVSEWVKEEPASTKYFVCANPHSIQLAEKDHIFKKSLMGADLITPDGVGIVYASRLLGGNITERVTGSDVFQGINEVLNLAGGFRYFFLGSTDEVLSRVESKMASDFPGINVVGTYSPPFRAHFTEKENRKMVEIINNMKPDVLWVGMTAPKQEKWIYENLDCLDVKLIGPIGAVFDFYSGNKRRSPKIFQKYGLEWLPRLFKEPKRLWRRMFVSAPIFICQVIKQKLETRKRSP